ncbi:MAG: MlaE family ABC transporter permease [Kiritimatiellia bacterium]
MSAPCLFVLKTATTSEIARAWRGLQRVDRLKRGEEVLLDVSALAEMSAAAEAFFLAVERRAAVRGATLRAVDPKNLLEPVRARFDFAAFGPTAVPRRERPWFLESLGRAFCAGLGKFRAVCAFLGETFAEFLGVCLHPWRFRLGDALLAFERACCDGLPISASIGFLLGLILAFQSAASLKMFGVEVYVADLIAIGIFRELGPLVTAIVLAGRSGSAFAAEIGTMKVDEELDALATMGLPPVRFLVLPRVVAAVFAMPVLTICAELAGLLGGVLVLQTMGVPAMVFWTHVTQSTTPFMILFGLGKAALFGFLVGLIGCDSGMRTRSTADGVGVAATTAVVGGIVAIAVSDGLLAVICFLFDL